MSDPAPICDLINDIYDAALDGSRWPDVLQRTITLINGMSAAVFFRNSSSPDGNFQCSVGMDPHFSQLYSQHYVWISPLVPYEERLPAGTVFAGSDAMPYEDLRASVFFNEWARPQHFADFVGAVLEKSPVGMAKLFVNRHERQGPVDADARLMMQRLAPHFRRAILIGKTLDSCESKAAMLGDVLDRLPTAVVLIDRAGRLVYANLAGSQLLASGEVLTWADGKPKPVEERIAMRLQAILSSCGPGRAPYGALAFASSCNCASGERMEVQLLPLPHGTRRSALMPRTGVAAILVSRGAPDYFQRVEWAARLYDLTPGESRVVQALLSGGPLGSVAKTLGITEATVKTHLQHVFDKTGTRRQVDLIQLMTGALSQQRDAKDVGASYAASRPRSSSTRPRANTRVP